MDIISREEEEEVIITKMEVLARMDSKKESASLINKKIGRSLKLKKILSSAVKLTNLSKSCSRNPRESLRRLKVIRTPNRKLG